MSDSGKKSPFLNSVLGQSSDDDLHPTKSNNTSDNSLSSKIANQVAESIVKEAKNSVKTTTHNAIADLSMVSNQQVNKVKNTLDRTPAPLSLAIVGHTNTGKTSLLRTLLRDSGFGEVKNASATTKHVERISIFDGEQPLVDLFDTPGLEDASGLLDWLEDNTEHRADGVERLHTFLADTVAETEFNQESKVIRQLLASDVALYVIDSREPVLGKYKDELSVLSWCAKPVMPVFNFIYEVDQDNLSAWQNMLSRTGLHVSTGFDTVAFDFDGEIQLWQNLDTLLSNTAISNPKLTDTLKRLVTLREDEWQQLNETAHIEIAHTLLNIAAFKKEINEEDNAEPILQEMQEKVRQLERRLHSELLSIYRFYDSEIAPTQLELESFQRDPFDPELLKTYGIRTTSGAVAGALAGLGIDAATFGASLGLGAAIGGLIGGVLSNTQTISDKITGTQSLYIDPETITLIATRAKDLLSVLMQRGHADQSAITLNTTDPSNPSNKKAIWESHKLPKPLKKARGKTDWSELNTNNVQQAKTLRDEDAHKLALSMM